MNQQALGGITVLDFSTRLPGPLATLLLAQAGARVIKIERPTGGDELRAFNPRIDGMSAHFVWLNRGKESVTLDLKQQAGRDAVLEMVRSADVVVEQFRPGVMDRLGLGAEALRAVNPRLIYCSISGYGQDDSRSQEAAHDLNYQASAGLLSAAPLGVNGLPALPPVLLGDIAGGSYPAFMSILLALMQRAKSGKGQSIDVAMSRNVEVFAFWNAIQGHLGGGWPAPGQGRHTGGSPRYNLYRAADGKVLAVAALEDRFWQNFQEAIGITISPDQEREAPAAAIAAIASRISERESAHWLALTAGRDACCSLAADLPDVALRTQVVDKVPDGVGLPYIPLPVAEQFTSGAIDPPAPALGEQNGIRFDGRDRRVAGG